jgi:hypothetical protein
VASTVFTNSVTLTQAAWFQDVDNIAYQYLSAVAGTNTITATGPSGLGAYAAGLKFRFIPAVTNTGPTTINITGTAALGARNIFKAGVALTSGDLVAGIPVEIADDGTRFNIVSWVSAPTVLLRRKTADQALTTQIVLQNDSHLFFSIGASEEWTAEFFIDAGALLATTGFQIAITTPAGATQNIIAFLPSAIALNATTQRTATSGTALNYTPGNIASNDPGAIVISLWVLNGVTAGTVQLQFAQSTSSASALTFRKGSHMTAARIA